MNRISVGLAIAFAIICAMLAFKLVGLQRVMAEDNAYRHCIEVLNDKLSDATIQPTSLVCADILER